MVTDLIITAYDDAAAFLNETQGILLRREAKNNLLLGTCLDLQQNPENAKAPTYFSSVAGQNGPFTVAVMTAPRRLLVYSEREDCDKAAEMIVRNFLDNGGEVSNLSGPLGVAERFAAKWAEISGGTHKTDKHMRLYEARQIVHPKSVAGRLRLATDEDSELIVQWAIGLENDIGANSPTEETEAVVRRKIALQNFYLWEDGIPVSMAARIRPTPNGIAVGGVYTPPELRRKGYASACVADLSQMLLDSGLEFCMLFADLANPTSNSIYQKMGYTPICYWDSYALDEK